MTSYRVRFLKPWLLPAGIHRPGTGRRHFHELPTTRPNGSGYMHFDLDTLDPSAMHNQSKEIVRTSQPGWLGSLAQIYRHRRPALLLDDAGFGIDPASQTLLDMAKQAGLSKQELAAMCVAVGMSAAGIGMIVLAFVDPEPTSKLGLLVGGGAVCVLSGGFTAIRILTKHKPPNIRVTAGGIEITWA